MTQHAHQSSQAHQAHQAHQARHATPQASPAARAAPTIAVVMVTWNRQPEVRRAVESVLDQRGVDRSALHLVIVDNASIDGTADALAAWLAPERRVHNDTPAADAPRWRTSDTGQANTAGLASVTIVQNASNLGGTGGFNTGFQAVEHFVAAHANVDFLWLLDDDAVADQHALASMLQTAANLPQAGLIGARAVDIADRRTTYETTIYYDANHGRMADAPHPGHRLHDAHALWIERVGATRGDQAFAGVREVDVVSAASMLARWSVVQRVGYWDSRYFIYCDDADWCLRVGRAGYTVLCDLDAVVYHTPWFQKLTPTRLYYAQRNAIWTMRKALGGAALRRGTARWMVSVLRASLGAGLRRRRFHAEILRRTALDAATNRSGKLDFAEPPHESIEAAVRRLQIDRPRARVAFLAMTPEQVDLAAKIRAELTAALGDRCPKFQSIVRRDAGKGDFAYEPGPRSKLRALLPTLASPPDACVVLNNTNDFPLLRCPITLHVDHRAPHACQVEHDHIASRAAFLARWAYTALRAVVYILLPDRQRPRAPFG